MGRLTRCTALWCESVLKQLVYSVYHFFRNRCVSRVTENCLLHHWKLILISCFVFQPETMLVRMVCEKCSQSGQITTITYHNRRQVSKPFEKVIKQNKRRCTKTPFLKTLFSHYVIFWHQGIKLSKSFHSMKTRPHRTTLKTPQLFFPTNFINAFWRYLGTVTSLGSNVRHTRESIQRKASTIAIYT